MDPIRRSPPDRWEMLPVFGIFCFFCFSWSLYRLFWYIPSWMEYLSIWKVLIIICYVLAFALIESLVMALLTTLFLKVFPKKVINNRFVLIASSLSVLVSLAAFLLQRKISLVYRLEIWQILLYALIFLLLLVGGVFLMGLILDRQPKISRFGADLVERMTIFAYIYVPLGLIGLIVVILRNLVGF